QPCGGQSPAVFGGIHRQGRLTLTLILPDGTKSLIPADWTDLAPTEPPRGVIGAKQIATRDSLEALIHASALVDALLHRSQVRHHCSWPTGRLREAFPFCRCGRIDPKSAKSVLPSP